MDPAATAVPPTSPRSTPPAPPARGPGLLDGFEEGVVVCDRDGVVRAANHAARRLVPATHVHRAGPDVVAVSSSLPSRLPAARRMVEACRATGTPVLAGGPAFGEDGRWARAVGADGWAPDARAAAAMLAADPDGPWLAGEPRGAGSDDRGAREEQTVLHARRAELVGLAAAAARPGSVDVPDELADDLGHLVDFLAAAVFVEDPSLFEGFVSWVGSVAIPSGLRVAEVAPALDALAAALGDSPRTVRLLRDARASLPAAPA